MQGFVAGSLELAVDSNVGILVETGIALETGFGCCSAFDNCEIMVKETESPFEGFGCMGMLECMRLALGLFDEFTIRYTGCRPGLGKMVGIELEKAVSIRHAAYYDVFFVTDTFFDGIHGAPEGFVESNRHEIAHSSGTRCGVWRE